MTIRIYDSNINFGSFALEIAPYGLNLTNNSIFFAAAVNYSPPLYGTSYGFTSGGEGPAGVFLNVIERFPFATNSNAADYGDLTVSGMGGSGTSSTSHGFTAGRSSPSTGVLNTIDRFPFASAANATDVGNLSFPNYGNTRYASAGQSSLMHGYTSGGFPTKSGAGASGATIDRFVFSTTTNAGVVGSLTASRSFSAGQSSSTHGFTTAGVYEYSGDNYNIIDRFPFATNANASDVGDITVTRVYVAGQSSLVSGYTSGGSSDSPITITGATNIIDKFPFASNSNATDVGDLTLVRFKGRGGHSSTTSGYTSGGYGGSPNLTASNVIDKFPFAIDTNASDVGDLIGVRFNVASQQD